MDGYDVIVIGTGTAAQVTAASVRRAGRSVAVIDHRPFGGTCALRGCDPADLVVLAAGRAPDLDALNLSAALSNRSLRHWPHAFVKNHDP